jgi:hypothetical protein
VLATATFLAGAARPGVPWRQQAESVALASSVVDGGRPLRPDAAQSDSRPATAQFSGDWKDGDEVFALDPKILAHIDFETEAKTIVVRRAEGSRNRFGMTVTTRATGRVEQCKADALVRVLLPSLSSIRVKRTFTPAEAKALWARQGQKPAVLRIADTLDVDAKEFQVLLTELPGSSAGTSVVFREQTHVFVPSVKADTVRRLGAGCTKPVPTRSP